MEWCEYYEMECDEVPEKIIIINEDDEVECDAVCDLDCEHCSWRELK